MLVTMIDQDTKSSCRENQSKEMTMETIRSKGKIKRVKPKIKLKDKYLQNFNGVPLFVQKSRGVVGVTTMHYTCKYTVKEKHIHLSIQHVHINS